jgi:hypothetical protein
MLNQSVGRRDLGAAAILITKPGIATVFRRKRNDLFAFFRAETWVDRQKFAHLMKNV